MGDFARSPAIDEDIELGLTLNINEAGRNDQAVSVNAVIGRCFFEIVHGGDAVAPNGDVAVMPGCAGAIDNAGAGDDEIVGGLLSLAAEC